MIEITAELAAIFQVYFNVADEIYESIVKRMDQTKPIDPDACGEWYLTLADLDDRDVKRAKTAAFVLSLSWPPYLPEAEEFALRNHDRLNA